MTPRKRQLRQQLADANDRLASVEAARAELAEISKAALDNREELEALKAENKKSVKSMMEWKAAGA